MEKDKEVIIDIESIIDTDGDISRTQMTIVGTYFGTPKDYCIQYKEIGGELDGCVTLLRVKNNKTVTLIRKGSYNSEITIEHKKRHVCHYDTPYGALLMGIFAQEIESNLTDVGGKLRFKYTVDFNSDLVSTNEMMPS